ncbi:MAG: hypothetical protein AB1721_00300 [Patescibacteria group bacterium]
MDKKLDVLALANASAIISALGMVLLGIAANLGIYTGAAEMMIEWHLFFSLSFWGIIAGAVEAAALMFFAGAVFAWVYNKLIK